jgi:hypothetical protein
MGFPAQSNQPQSRSYAPVNVERSSMAKMFINGELVDAQAG